MQTFPRKKTRFQQTNKVHHYVQTYKYRQLKDILRQRLIEPEDFWIQTLDMLYPKELNHDLST